jgi:RNA polymerase sigma-B factor
MWLDAPIGDAEDGDGTFGELIAVTDPGYDRTDAKVTVERLTRELDHRTREILHLRFEHDLTQAEIARRTGVSQMHVSRTLRTALRNLHDNGLKQWRAA